MWLALRFPHWALDSHRAAGAGEQAGLVAESHGGRRVVVAADAAALTAGVRRGMPLADARIALPGVCVYARHVASEVAALERLAGWAWRYSNQVHIACADNAIECTRLIIEIGASLRLFGGRRALLAAIRDDLAALGYRCRTGIGVSPQAALAFARAPRRRHGQTLESLPLDCLELAPRTAASLAASGLATTGELLALPPGALARRYGQSLLDYLERLRGRRPHGLSLYQLPERYGSRQELIGAVETTQGLKLVLRRLFVELDAFLRGAAAAIQTLRLTLVHESGPATQITLRLATPSRDAEHLARVADERLARLTLAAPVIEIALASDRLRPSEAQQQNLWRDAGRAQDDAWPAVLDRLRARLGHNAVGWLHTNADHRPEAASALRDQPPARTEPLDAPRPLWLLDTPQPLADQPLEFVTAAERIETGWWQDNVRRDYFRARDAHGRLLWLYRDLRAARDAAAPAYYLHGLFG